MPPKEKITPAHVRFPSSLWERAKAMAVIDRRSANALVITLVEDGLNRMEAERKKKR